MEEVIVPNIQFFSNLENDEMGRQGVIYSQP